MQKRPDCTNILIADVPDGLVWADWIEKVNVRSDEASGMRPRKRLKLDAIDPLTWNLCAVTLADENFAVDKLR